MTKDAPVARDAGVYDVRVHLSRCLPPGTPEEPRLRPREGSKSEKTQCGACGMRRVDMYSHKRFCRGLDEEPPGANQVRGGVAEPPPPFSRPTEIRRRMRGKQSVPNEEVRREREEASPERRVAGETEEESGPRVHHRRAVHAQGPRGEIRQRATRNYHRRTADSDTRSCTTTSTANWAGERTCPYCNRVFSFAMHRYNCSAAPYEVWHEHLMKKRARSAPLAVIAAWTNECPHLENHVRK